MTRNMESVYYRTPRSTRTMLSHRLFVPVAGAAMLAMAAMPSVSNASTPAGLLVPAVAGTALETDGDGYSDQEEIEAGSDTNNPESFPGDLDGDMLADETEAEIGTDPLEPDTDDDGLSDFAEVGFEPGSSTGTDPLVADTDGDGYLDGEEVPAGSDPTNPDSTPDGGVTLDRDEDGLIDEVELSIGTDTAVFDTDGDGLGDGAEYNEDQWGTNPLKADTDGDGYNDGDELFTYGTDPNDANDFPRDGGSAAPSARPSASPGAVVGLPSTGTGTAMDTGNGGVLALIAGAMASVAAAFGIRRRVQA